MCRRLRPTIASFHLLSTLVIPQQKFSVMRINRGEGERGPRSEGKGREKGKRMRYCGGFTTPQSPSNCPLRHVFEALCAKFRLSLPRGSILPSFRLFKGGRGPDRLKHGLPTCANTSELSQASLHAQKAMKGCCHTVTQLHTR